MFSLHGQWCKVPYKGPNHRVTQNSGIFIEGDHEGEIHDFYGHVCKIWELEYMFHRKVVFFSNVNGTILVPMVEGE